MLDARYVADHLDEVRTALRRRSETAASALDGIAKLSERRRTLIGRTETLQAERKHEHYEAQVKEKTLRQAVMQIVIADVSMSIDNVLAVAGAAREHATVLVFGLALSVLLMGLAATLIARLLEKHRWIAYIGLGIIVFVAAEMIYRGAQEVLETPAVEKVIDERLNGALPGVTPF